MSRINEKIDAMFDNDMMEDLLEIDLGDSIEDVLYDYQVVHLYGLITAFENNNVIVDGSDTGTGKTYTSIALCKHLKLTPFVICPKIVMNKWKEVMSMFGVKPLSIVNYETIKQCKEYDKDMKRVESKYLHTDAKKEYKWKKMPANSIIIFDEVHLCKNKSSQNGKLLYSTKKLPRVLMLSATLSDSAKSFQLFGYMIGLYKSVRSANSWFKTQLKEEYNSDKHRGIIYKQIYPKLGARMIISELGDKFKQNTVTTESYDHG